MSAFRVEFEAMPWEEGRPGVRFRTYREGGRVLRLVEFSTAEGFDGWCERGHIGYVLQGGLTISFDGRHLDFLAGDGLFIPDGAASRHHAVRITPGTRLLMVEDDEPGA